MEKARVTEVQVRIDCNGCVQKIKKALQGIKGISHVYIDLPRQKLTIIGSADPERIIKAIKKARKNATIYTHSELQQEPPPTDPTPPESEATPPPDDVKPPGDQPEPPNNQVQSTPPSELPKDQQPPPPAENPTNPPPAPPENRPINEPPSLPVEEVHVIHHHPPDYCYRPGYGPGYNPEPPRNYNTEQPRSAQSYGAGYNPGPPHRPHNYGHEYDHGHHPEQIRYNQSYNAGYNPGIPSYNPSYNSGQPGHSQGYEPGYNTGQPGHNHPEQSYRPERLQPVQVTHSYNQYRPPPNVTQYEYFQPPPRFAPYARNESYYYYNNGDYQNDISNSNNGYASSIFSEENPNACTIS